MGKKQPAPSRIPDPSRAMTSHSGVYHGRDRDHQSCILSQHVPGRLEGRPVHSVRSGPHIEKHGQTKLWAALCNSDLTMHPEDMALLGPPWGPNLRDRHSHLLSACYSCILGTLKFPMGMIVNAFHIVTAPSIYQWGRRRKAPGMFIAIVTAGMEVFFQTKGIPYFSARFPRLLATTVAYVVPMMLQKLGDLAWVLPRGEFDTHVHMAFHGTRVDPHLRDTMRKNSFAIFLDESTRKIPIIFYSLCQVGQGILGTVNSILFASLMIYLNTGFRLACGQTSGVIDNWRCEVHRNKAL